MECGSQTLTVRVGGNTTNTTTSSVPSSRAISVQHYVDHGAVETTAFSGLVRCLQDRQAQATILTHKKECAAVGLDLPGITELQRQQNIISTAADGNLSQVWAVADHVGELRARKESAMRKFERAVQEVVGGGGVSAAVVVERARTILEGQHTLARSQTEAHVRVYQSMLDTLAAIYTHAKSQLRLRLRQFCMERAAIHASAAYEPLRVDDGLLRHGRKVEQEYRVWAHSVGAPAPTLDTKQSVCQRLEALKHHLHSVHFQQSHWETALAEAIAPMMPTENENISRAQQLRRAVADATGAAIATAVSMRDETLVLSRNEMVAGVHRLEQDLKNAVLIFRQVESDADHRLSRANNKLTQDNIKQQEKVQQCLDRVVIETRRECVVLALYTMRGALQRWQNSLTSSPSK